MTTLLLVRHGQTVDNVNQIMQGQTQGQLTPLGIQQAEQVAAQMDGVRIDAYVSSDLKRSYDTCAIIAGSRSDAIVTTPLLRERDWGGFTGRFIPDLKDQPWPDDIESLEALKERARKFLQFITSQYPGQTVLAVGHGIINKAVQAVFYHKPMKEVPRMANAEIRQLIIP